VGRVETVIALQRRFDEVRAGAGGVTLLVGDTGVGKTALIAELVRQMRARGALVLIGRAPALDDPPPYWLVRSAIESAHDDPALKPGRTAPVGGDEFLLGFAPGLSEASVSGPIGIEERLLELLSGTHERGEGSQDRVRTAIVEQFLVFTRHGPTVLVLEDLHHADESSLVAVEYLAKQLTNQPLWVLGTTRSHASLSGAGRTRLEAFQVATEARPIVLRPMTSGEAAEYLRVSDPTRKFSPEEVARRYSETGGNPLLLQQFDRHSSSAEEGGAPGGAGLPPLDPGAQRALDVGAVLGPEFSFALLLRASGEQDEERLAETVDRLVGHGILLERPGELLAFPEDRLREEVYDRLTESRRRILHWSAGETLEAMGSGGLATVYALARHFYLGQVSRKSVQYNRMAAEIAERALAPDVAREHLSRALESQRGVHPENIDGEAELALELARISEELGHLKESEGILRRFLARAKDDPRLSPSRRATLEIFLGRVLTDRGEMPAAGELARKILSSPGLERQLLVQVGAHHQLGQVLYYEGHYAEALAQHTEEIRLARELGNPQVILRAQIWRVAALAMMGEIDQAIAEAREVTVARDGLGSVRESAQAHLFLGDMLADARCPPPVREEAVGEYAQAIRFAEKAQDPRRIAWALYKTSELLRETGRLDEALEKAQGACDLFGRIGDQVGLSVSLKVRGQVAIDQGRYDAAQTDLLEAHRLLQGLKHTLEEIDVVLRLAQLSLVRGDRATTTGLVADLERQNLPTIRPDLSEEFARLKRGLDHPPKSGPEP